jgi:HEAT repeat protein
LRDAVAKGQIDARAVVRDRGIDPELERGRLSEDILTALGSARSPRLINRLLRAAADLKLTPVLPRAIAYRDSPSSLVRAAAARAIGSLAEPEEGEPLLQAMATDPRPEVQHAFQAALKDLRTSQAPAEEAQVEEEPAPALGGEALSALERLKAQLESGGE